MKSIFHYSFGVAIIILTVTSAIAETKYKNEKHWEKCEARTMKAAGTKYGNEGIWFEVVNKCGYRPVVKSKKRISIMQKDCKQIFTYLKTCSENTECSREHTNMLSAAEYRTFIKLDPKAFNEGQFNTVCYSVCITGNHNPSDYKFFEEVVCSQDK